VEIRGQCYQLLEFDLHGPAKEQYRKENPKGGGLGEAGGGGGGPLEKYRNKSSRLDGGHRKESRLIT